MRPVKVMIVDDNQDLAQALELRLRANRYDTVCVSDGKSAIRVAAAENISVLILDLFLPREDGLEVLRQLRAMPGLSSLPAIVVTADRSAATRQRSLNAGACAILEKPVDHRVLLETLHLLQKDSAGSHCVIQSSLCARTPGE
jgi:DNA-binding response OmpR family regulator